MGVFVKVVLIHNGTCLTCFKLILWPFSPVLSYEITGGEARLDKDPSRNYGGGLNLGSLGLSGLTRN